MSINSGGVRPKVAWFVPPLLHGSGGISNMFQKANAMVRAGFECHMYIEPFSGADQSNIKDWVEGYYGKNDLVYYCGFQLFADYDLIIATVFYSAAVARNTGQNCPKVYFVQDYEAYFHSMGTGFLTGENSYTYGLIPVTSGRWLTHVLGTDYGIPGTFIDIGADISTYYPISGFVREKAVCFIYQPKKFRRSPELGIRALELVKQRHPDVRIYTFGSDDEILLDFEHVNLGMLPGPKEINELYNRCKVGLCISSTNPSRVPYEMMAAGLPMVDVYRYNNLFDMPEGGIFLAHQTSESLAEAIIGLLDDDAMWTRASQTGPALLQQLPIEKEHASFVRTISRIFLGWRPSFQDLPLSYKREPIIADSIITDAVQHYCRRQASLAGRCMPSAAAGDQFSPAAAIVSRLGFCSSEPQLDRSGDGDPMPGSWDEVLSLGYKRLARLDVAALDMSVDETNFDEDFYRANYPDVARALRTGELSSGYQHYDGWGRYENRRVRRVTKQSAPILSRQEFDEAYYLQHNRDVRDAVVNGKFKSGYEHYIESGMSERRSARSLRGRITG